MPEIDVVNNRHHEGVTSREPSRSTDWISILLFVTVLSAAVGGYSLYSATQVE